MSRIGLSGLVAAIFLSLLVLCSSTWVEAPWALKAVSDMA